MPDRRKALAFDVDADTLAAVRQALPRWEVEAVAGATPGSLSREWNPGAADLLVVGARDPAAATVGLCRSLRRQVGRSHTALIALALPGQEALAGAAEEAGADGCLFLPVRAPDLAALAARAIKDDRRGRHARDRARAQLKALWRDDGGEG
jgi:DNA-binding response OmpR family regulator